MAPIEDSRDASPTKSVVGKVEAIGKYVTPPRSPITSTSSSPANSDPSDEEQQRFTKNCTMVDTTTSSSPSSSYPSSDEELLIKNAGKEAPPKSPLSSSISTRICDKEEQPLWSTVEVDNLIALYKYRATPLPKSTILEYFSPQDDDMDPAQYFEKRLNTLAALKESGKNPYPNTFTFSMSISEFIHKYGSIKPNQHKEYVIECLAGRLMNKLSSSDLITYDLVGFGGQVQVMALPKFSYLDQAAFFTLHSKLKCGDYVGVIGFPGRSGTGEMSIIPRSIVSLSYCLRKIPPTYPNLKKMDAWTPGTGRYPDAYLLKDQETRYRHRFLDLMINSEVKDICKTRAKVVSYIRRFLDNLGFLEVETPILTMVPGGAAARPFVTYYNDLDMKMCMRIAPELYLKQLVVGGIERVYEIGKQFRNEGTDLIHNPEFTSCEFCMTLADYKDLMELTEQLLSGMVKELTGGYKVTYHANGYDNLPIEIDFTPPFRRISMIEELEKMANISIPKDLASDEARQYLADICTKFDINCQPPQTAARLLDKLVRNFLVDTCVNPTFIMEHPEIMSPLAKSHETKLGLTERFELFVNKFELINAYTELDDPVVQRQRFADQLKDRQSGDEQAMPLDETFCMALEYGLPPSAGWGLGIDRLTMLLTDSQNIKEVILFPAMKPQPHNESPIKEEIVAAVINNNVEDEEVDDMPSEEPVTLQEAIIASKTLHKFLLQSGNTRPASLSFLKK